MAWYETALVVLEKVKFWDRAADVAADVVSDMLMKEDLEDLEPQEAFELGHEFALFQRDVIALALNSTGIMQGSYKVNNWKRMRLLVDSLSMEYNVSFFDEDIDGKEGDPDRFTLTVAHPTKE